MALRISGDGSLNYLDATFNNVTASGLSASGDVVLPSTTEIGAVSSTELGYVDGVTSALQTQLNTLDSGLASKLDLAGGKILQIVRATDSTNRTTTSTSFVDSSLSVTITPQKNTSAVILIAQLWVQMTRSDDGLNAAVLGISDSSNNLISGAESVLYGINNYTGTGTRTANNSAHVWAYATPATTSATTYKLRYRGYGSGQTVNLFNSNNTAQMYAIEVSA